MKRVLSWLAGVALAEIVGWLTLGGATAALTRMALDNFHRAFGQ